MSIYPEDNFVNDNDDLDFPEPTPEQRIEQLDAQVRQLHEDIGIMISGTYLQQQGVIMRFRMREDLGNFIWAGSPKQD